MELIKFVILSLLVAIVLGCFCYVHIDTVNDQIEYMRSRLLDILTNTDNTDNIIILMIIS